MKAHRSNFGATAAANLGPRPEAGWSWRGALGFTVLEVLVALALAGALLAVVLPATLGWIPAASLDEAAPRVETAIALARADAQRRGEVLEVVAIAGRGGEIELFTRPMATEGAEAGLGPTEESESASVFLVDLPRGVVLRWSGSESEPADWSVDPRNGAGGPIGQDEADSIVLALALPNGRVVSAGDRGSVLRAVARDGRWVHLSINAWTGAVTSAPGSMNSGADDRDDNPREDPAEDQ